MWSLLLACASKSPTAMPPAELVESSPRATRITGTAENAKLSAVVIGPTGHVYLLDRREWPPEVLGTTVTVEGVLETTDEFAATRGPDGAISQGTTGGDTVMRTSTLVQ